MKKVCIVIPVYKQNLNLFEKISLQQVLRTLGHYPIYLISPDTLEIQYEELSGYQYSVCQFDERYFQNTAAYSELMLSSFFYERFLEYKYMLVYQLDCFVFFDGLSDFCDMDYDYIGAPQYHSWTKDIVVGNGGLSLRKTDAVLRVVKQYDEIVQEPYYRDYFRKWEDNFFSYCGRKRETGFKVPEISLANSFSTVMDVENSIQNIPVKGLPFGTHGWDHVNFGFWKDIIKAYGYPSDKLIAEKNNNTLETDRNIRCRDYFLGAIPGFASDKKEEIAKELGLPRNKKYVMWGAGDFGKKSLKVLLALGMNIVEVFDSNPKENQLFGLSVSCPDYQKMREQKVTVLIGSVIYKKEIEQDLLEHGCKDFIDLSNTFNKKLKFLQDEYLRSIPDMEGITIPFHFMEDKSWIPKIVSCVQNH